MDYLLEALKRRELFGWLRLPVSALPEVDFPTIEVSTRLPGASPETVAVLVTASLERQLAQIAGLVDHDRVQCIRHQTTAVIPPSTKTT